MMVLEVEEQGKSETMENEWVPMLSNDYYHQWKEKMKYNLMKCDIWYLLYHGYTKIPPSDEEVQKNSKELSDIINIIPDSTLNMVMHYTIAKKVWDKIQAIHEEILKEYSSSGELLGNYIPKNVLENEHDNKTTFVMSDGVVDSEEDMLEEIFYLRTKLDLSLKNIVNIKDK